MWVIDLQVRAEATDKRTIFAVLCVVFVKRVVKSSKREREL